MARGRNAKPAEVKALLGNPGKRRLALDQVANGGKSNDAQQRKRRRAPKVEPPAFLTQEEEQKFFNSVLAVLPANLVRQSDTYALARWASWLHIWVTCKLALDNKRHWYTTTSAHSPEIHREHPLSKRMDKAEAHLVTLEDRLCLNIVARNNVMHRLINMPAGHPNAGLFDDEPTDDDKKPARKTEPDKTPELSPLNFVAQAAEASKPH